MNQKKKTTRRELTRRQREVLILRANGLTINEVATELDIAVSTVNTRMRLVLRTLGVKNCTQATAVGLSLGEIGVQDIEIPLVQQET